MNLSAVFRNVESCFGEFSQSRRYFCTGVQCEATGMKMVYLLAAGEGVRSRTRMAHRYQLQAFSWQWCLTRICMTRVEIS